MRAARKCRTQAHVRADIGLRYVQWICARAGFTTSDAPQGADYGIDLSLQTFDRGGEAESEEVRLQVKAISRLNLIEDSSQIAYAVDKRDLRSWLEHIFPVILVVFHPPSSIAYWVYVQRYCRHHGKLSLNSRSHSRTIHISLKDQLDVPAVRHFAKWKNDIVRQAKRMKLHV